MSVANEANVLKKTQNYTICFRDNNITNIGFIKKIYYIKKEVYLLIQKFEKIRAFSSNLLIEEKLSEFFALCS